MKKSRGLKKLIAFPLVLVLSISVSMTGQVGFAYGGVPTWFESGVNEAEEWGLIPDNFDHKAMNEPISRGEFAEAVILAYVSVTGELPETWENKKFNDKSNAYADVAYALQIITGYPDGSFKPEGAIKREEMFVMIYKLLAKLQTVETLDVASIESFIGKYSDTLELSSWANEATALVVSRQIVSGTDKGTLEPKKNTTRAQALVILNNAVKTVANEPVSHRRMNHELEELVKMVNESSQELASPVGSTEVKKYVNIDELSAASNAEVVVSRGSYRDHKSFEELLTPEELLVRLGNNSVKYALIFGSADAERYQTAEVAAKNLVTVSVDVWVLGNNGLKTPGKRSIIVHKSIADTVVKIFKEIYAGPEKFPIKYSGGYAWRPSSTSEHRWGLAIDLNPNENYMIRNDGTVVAGSFWKPGENPYSIKPNGDVVNAFKKYGFSWGGDAWPMSHDYMHFSFLGE